MINEIKTIIESLGLQYVRAINTKDLGERAINLQVDQLGVLAGLISIDAELNELNDRSLETWEITILFLELSPGLDAPGEEIDASLEVLYQKAIEFISELQKITPNGYWLEGYSLESTDSVNITSEILIGWELKISVPRTIQICQS
jgi:hypothetical protein